MPKVEIYTKSYCPYCHRAKARLDARNVAYEEIDITFDEAGQREMQLRSNRRTVPQIFIDGTPIGGSDDLEALLASGEFDRLMNSDLEVA